MALFASPFFKQIHRLLVCFKMASPTDDDYLQSPYPFSLTVPTACGQEPSVLQADNASKFFEFLEQDSRSKNCLVTEVSIFKEDTSKFQHEFLMVSVAGPDGDKTYSFFFERTGGEDHGEESTPPGKPTTSMESMRALQNASPNRVHLVSSQTRLAKHQVTVFRSAKQSDALNSRPVPTGIATNVYTRSYDVRQQSRASASSSRNGAGPSQVQAPLSLYDFARIALSALSQRRYYNLLKGSCYWLVAVVSRAVEMAQDESVTTTLVSGMNGKGMPAGRISLWPTDVANVTPDEVTSIVRDSRTRGVVLKDASGMIALLANIIPLFDAGQTGRANQRLTGENDELRVEVAAKNEALAAKDEEIAAKDEALELALAAKDEALELALAAKEEAQEALAAKDEEMARMARELDEVKQGKQTGPPTGKGKGRA